MLCNKEHLRDARLVGKGKPPHRSFLCAGGAEGLELLSVAFLNGGLIPGLHRPTLQQRLLHNKYVGPWVGPLLTKSRFSAALAKTFGPATQPWQAFLEESYAALAFNGGHMIMHECALFSLPTSAEMCDHKYNTGTQ